MEREALKLALEALDVVKLHYTQNRHVNEAITAIKAALAQPEQEPVAWQHSPTGVIWSAYPRGYQDIVPLYTSPPQRQPLTGEEMELLIEDIAEWSRYVEVDTAPQNLEKHVRQVLSAHGIGDKT